MASHCLLLLLTAVAAVLLTATSANRTILTGTPNAYNMLANRVEPAKFEALCETRK
jgi:hypothetical protein